MSREPWKKRRADGDKFHIVEDGIWVATVHGENADVVTASRDLLEACEAVADFIDENANIFPNGAVAGEMWRRLDLAIAKAKGR